MSSAMRDIDDAVVEKFQTDGVVCLRQQFDPHWIDLTRRGIQRNLENPGRFFRDHTPEGSPGRYVFDFWSWPEIPEFRDLIFGSPAAAIAGRLMGAQKTVLLMDNWFMRERGATNGAPWHHDEPYFDFEGRMCILWMPMEPVSREDGLRFVKGSHRWGKLFMASQFSENVPFTCDGDDYAEVPDIDAAPGEYEFLSWDMEPGDCLVFDFRTLHAATAGNTPLDQTIHRMSLRFGAEDVMFRPRGEWTREIAEYLMKQGQQANACLETRITPLVWER